MHADVQLTTACCTSKVGRVLTVLLVFVSFEYTVETTNDTQRTNEGKPLLGHCITGGANGIRTFGYWQSRSLYKSNESSVNLILYCIVRTVVYRRFYQVGLDLLVLWESR